MAVTDLKLNLVPVLNLCHTVACSWLAWVLGVTLKHPLSEVLRKKVKQEQQHRSLQHTGV
jgi:hypothetical protein